ncbi:MAG: DUF2927 domain-containing protein [Methanoregula sp.]|jgi:hypothetical protein
MKSSSVFLILGILIISVGLAWIISGGIAEPAARTVTPTLAPATPTIAPVTTMVTTVPVTTVPAATVATAVTAATPPGVTSAPASAENIRDHFLEVAYSGTNRLERLNYTSDKSRVVIYAVSAGDDDLALIEKTAKDFNAASPTVKLSENIKESGSGDIVIKFLPEDGLSAVSLMDAPVTGPFPEELTRGELYQKGIPAAKIIRATIYINANLKGDDRRHVLVRSMMYEMGLTGDSSVFSDSVFYGAENTNVDLTTADRKVITMLYSNGAYNGMTVEDLQKVIYLP